MLPRCVLQNSTIMPANKHFPEYCEILEAMPTVHLALKLGVLLVTPTAFCDNSYFDLKNFMPAIVSRQSMKHARQAGIVQLDFESDLTKK